MQEARLSILAVHPGATSDRFDPILGEGDPSIGPLGHNGDVNQALSEQSLAEWEALAQGAGGDVPGPMGPELLYQFLIGVHRRGEELSAHELKTLVDQVEMGPELARELMDFMGPAMELLEAYDRSLSATDDEEEDPEVAYVGDDDVGPGILVI